MGFSATPKFPGALAGAADLLNQKNLSRGETIPSLLVGIFSTDTSFSVLAGQGASLPPNDFVVTIDSEIIFVGTRSGDVCSGLTRGYEGTTAANHAPGSEVNAFITAVAHNQLAAEVGAIESTLGTNLSNVAIPFSKVESGDNTTAAMVVDSGASLTHAGSGVIDATEINGIPITGALSHPGQIPISQPGNASAVWADPLVQGIQAEGTSASTVNPVLVAGKDGSGNLKDLVLDSAGRPTVNVNGTIPVSASSLPVLGTVAEGSPVAAPIVIAGKDGSGNVKDLVLDSSGRPTVNVNGTVAISAASLPALPAHQSTNVDQINGTVPDTNSGTKSAGTLRVVLATDQPQLTNKLLVTPDALPAHQSTNVDQWNGTTVTAPPDSAGAIPVTGGGPSGNVGTFNNASGTPTTAIISNSNHYSSLVLQVITSGGAMGSSAWVLEGSLDNTNWNPLPSYRTAAGAATDPYTGINSNPVVFPSGVISSYIFTVAGFPYLRFRITTIIPSGTQQAVVNYALLNEPAYIPVQYPKIVPVTALAQTEPTTTVQIANDLVGTNAALAVTICAQTAGPGNNSGAMLRTPSVFKTATVNASTTGNSAVWTPTSGKKFRLMRFQITAQGLAATATGVVTVSFQDATTGITIGTYDIDVPAVAGIQSGITQVSGGWIDLGNGVLSASANNVLNFNISAAGSGTVGTYRINVCGTEE
jgi:hypothetical protein